MQPSHPPLGTQGVQPFHPPPWPPGLYGYPGPGGQYRATGLGMSAPQLNHGAPPYPGPGDQRRATGLGMSVPQLDHGAPPYPPMPPFSGQGAGLWGYGHLPPGSLPGPFPYPGDLRLTSSAPARTNAMQVRAEDVRQLSNHAATSHLMALTEFQPKRNYPNKQVSDNGMLH